MFEKQIKINCSWIPIEGKSTTNGHAWRSWTISLEASKVDLSEYIDHVEYILHESFGSSPIVCKEPPYTLQREGWGEFDLRILFHLSDFSLPSPQTVIFDLNFKKSKYYKYKKITLRSDSEYVEEDFIEEDYEIKVTPNRRRRRSRFSSHNGYGKKSENVRKRQRTIRSASSSSTISWISTPDNVNNKDIQQDQEEQHQIQQQYKKEEQVLLHQQGQQHEYNQHQHQLHPYKHETTSKSPHYILDPKNDLNLVLKTETIDLKELKALLEALDESNLRKAIKIIFSYDTNSHVIKITNDGYYMIDITCVCSDLVNELWKFVIDIEIEKCREGSTLSESAKEQH